MFSIGFPQSIVEYSLRDSDTSGHDMNTIINNREQTFIRFSLIAHIIELFVSPLALSIMFFSFGSVCHDRITIWPSVMIARLPMMIPIECALLSFSTNYRDYTADNNSDAHYVRVVHIGYLLSVLAEFVWCFIGVVWTASTLNKNMLIPKPYVESACHSLRTWNFTVVFFNLSMLCVSMGFHSIYRRFSLSRNENGTNHTAGTNRIPNLAIVDVDKVDLSGCPRNTSHTACCICQESFAIDSQLEILVLTRCNHMFHRKCLICWATHARRCPICASHISK